MKSKCWISCLLFLCIFELEVSGQLNCNESPCLNGGTCLKSSEGFRCHCPVDYLGRTCSIPSPATVSAENTSGCPCQYSFVPHNVSASEGMKTFCAQLFLNMTTWEDARTICRISNSDLTARIGFNSSLHATLKNSSVNLLWIGVYRRANFFVVESSAELFRGKTSDFWGEHWSENESGDYDCVALNVTSGSLISQNCSSILPFFCDDRNERQLNCTDHARIKEYECPEEWLLSYPLSTTSKKCIGIYANKSHADAEKICEHSRGRLATADEYKILQFENYLFPSIEDSGYWAKKGNDGSSCVFMYIPAASENITNQRPKNCSKPLPFVCVREYEIGDVKVQIFPDTFESFASSSNCSRNPDRFTCNVRVDNIKMSGQEGFLSYQWYKDDIPITINAYVFRMSNFHEALKNNPPASNIVTRQGSYHCEVRFLGSSRSYSSPKIDFFYSDIATYVIGINGILPNKYHGYSDQGFVQDVKDIDKWVMSGIMEKVKSTHPNAIWDFHSLSVLNTITTMNVLLYIYRTEHKEFDDDSSFQEIKTIFENSLSKENKTFTFNSADVCFSKDVESEKHTCKDSIIWHTTKQTKYAISEPMCLDKYKKPVRRKCQANNIKKAEWSLFDCSSCYTLQPMIKDLNFQCSGGFIKLNNSNMCYRIFYENKTWQDASEECSQRSSYMLSEEDNILEFPYDPTRFWLSSKYQDKMQNFVTLPAEVEWKNLIRSNHDLDLSCVSANLLNHNHSLKPENCSMKLPFVCIENPFELNSTVKFSNTWTKLANTCYYFADKDDYSWTEAKTKCEQMTPKADLLKRIQHLEPYRHFKMLMYKLFNSSGDSLWYERKQHEQRVEISSKESECHRMSWWMDFKGHETLLEDYVDWNPHVNFNINKDYGAMTLFSNKKIHWSLSERSEKYRYICEIRNCDDDRPTQAYIEDRFKIKNHLSIANYSMYHKNFALKCIPSGWFITKSIKWYKDGILIANMSNQFSFSHLPPTLQQSLQYQGYYFCSVEKTKSRQPVFSSKVLYKIPGIHTFVLSMQSERQCLGSTQIGTTFSSHEESAFVKCFNESLNESLNYFHFLFKNKKCNSTHVNITLHVHFKDESSKEDNIFTRIQNLLNRKELDYLHFSKECNIGLETITVRSTVSCYQEKTTLRNRNLSWPTTPIGEITNPKELCLTKESTLVERRCLGDFNIGAVWSPLSITECSDTQSDFTEKLYNKLQQGDASFESSRSLVSLTSSPNELIPADVLLTSKILTTFASHPSVAAESINPIVETISNLIDVPQNVITAAPNSSNRVIESLEHIASNISMNHSIQAAATNLAVVIHPLNSSTPHIPNCVLLTDWSKNLTTLFNATVNDLRKIINDFEAGIVLPPTLVAEQMNRSDRVIYAIRRNFNYVRNITVLGAVVQSSFGNVSVYDINPPVEIFFKLNKSQIGYNNSSAKCVFWDQRLNDEYGDWSYKGCQKNRSKDDLIICLCNHLTSFAVILEMNHENGHKAAQSIITYIGCSLSCFGLGMIMLTFICFKEWRKPLKNKAVFNLSACLLSVLILFMTGINQTSSWKWCLAIAVLLHYLLLATFAWMLVSAFMAYLGLVKVLGTYIPCLIQKAVAFSYGVPAVIVIATLSIKYDHYCQKNYCWLSQHVFYYAFAAPVLLMLIANFIIFVIILHANTCGKSQIYCKNNQDCNKLRIARAKALFYISILLGLSWIFGFLALGEVKIVFQYLFAITTSLQGFLLFMFSVVYQKSARDLWSKVIHSSAASEKSHISNISSSVSHTLTAIHNRLHSNPEFDYGNIHRSVIFKAHSPYTPYA